MKYAYITMLCLMVSSQCLSQEGNPLEDWRTPKLSETSQTWRDGDAGRFLVVKEDLNGDGITDIAKILISKRTPFRLALFAYLSQRDGSFKTFLLSERNEKSDLELVDIEKVPPGKYVTVCGKGVVECGPNLPEEINIQYYSVSFFKYDTGEVIYHFWDNAIKKFRYVAIDD